MIKKIERLGDRLLSRIVPRATASAAIPGCSGIYCGCIAGFDSYRITNNAPCGKCPGWAC